MVKIISVAPSFKNKLKKLAIIDEMKANRVRLFNKRCSGVNSLRLPVKFLIFDKFINLQTKCNQLMIRLNFCIVSNRHDYYYSANNRLLLPDLFNIYRISK